MRRIFYFADCLSNKSDFKECWTLIKRKFEEKNILFGLVNGTKDIWARDFMPFQRHDGEFVIYKYEPDYLKNELEYQTNCLEAFLNIFGRGILDSPFCHHTNLIIDGGNMIKCIDKSGNKCIIMTTKVLYENPGLSHRDIINELEFATEAEIILIPWDTEERYGHSDGMVRNIREGELLLNCYEDFEIMQGNKPGKAENSFSRTLKKSLYHKFNIKELRYGAKCHKYSWCHINYIDIGNEILVPVCGIPTDELALLQISIATGKKTTPIPMKEIIKEGGALHCISWDMDMTILIENNIMDPLIPKI